MPRLKLSKSNVRIPRSVAFDVDPEDRPVRRVITTPDYGGNYKLTVVMNSVRTVVFQTIDGLLPQLGNIASVEGWRRITAEIGRAGGSVVNDAIAGQSEVVTKVPVNLEEGEPPYYVLLVANFDGTWKEPNRGEGVTALTGTATAKIDSIAGPRGYIRPDASAGAREEVPLDGLAFVGESVPAESFEAEINSSVRIQLDSLFERIRRKQGGGFTWADFKNLWNDLFEDSIFEIHIKAAKYTLTVFPDLASLTAALERLTTTFRENASLLDRTYQHGIRQEEREHASRMESRTRELAVAIRDVALALQGVGSGVVLPKGSVSTPIRFEQALDGGNRLIREELGSRFTAVELRNLTKTYPKLFRLPGGVGVEGLTKEDLIRAFTLSVE